MKKEKQKFKVIFWFNGNIKKVEVEAFSKYDAKRVFYLTNAADDIIRIEEVKE